MGKCYLMYSENLDRPIDDWSTSGPHRFYFTQSYNVTERTFDEPPSRAMSIGQIGKGKGKAKGKGKVKGKIALDAEIKKLINKPTDDPPVVKLKTLDVFAGCGGEHSSTCFRLFILRSVISQWQLLFLWRAVGRSASSRRFRESLGDRERRTGRLGLQTQQPESHGLLRGLQFVAEKSYGCEW